MAAPIPDPPPVTAATLPANRTGQPTLVVGTEFCWIVSDMLTPDRTSRGGRMILSLYQVSMRLFKRVTA